MMCNELLCYTPRYFEALMRQYRLNIERADCSRDYMLSQLIAMVGNTGFRSFVEPRKPLEFLPGWQRERYGEPGLQRKRRVTKKKKMEVANKLRNVMDALMSR